MQLPRLQNAYLVARDMTALRRFYDQVLGLRLKFADGDRWTQYDAGPANFSLSSPDEAPERIAGAVLVFEVDDLGSHRTRIEAAGGRIIGTRDMDAHGGMLTFVDPEGNKVQLYCRARPRKD